MGFGIGAAALKSGKNHEQPDWTGRTQGMPRTDELKLAAEYSRAARLRPELGLERPTPLATAPTGKAAADLQLGW